MTLLYAWLLADFIAGVIHWAQDKLLVGQPSRFKIVNEIRADNVLHHDRPAAMLSFSYWDNISTSVIFAWPITTGMIFLDCRPVFYLAVFFSSFGNLVHRFAHLPKGKVSRPIRLLQATGLFISIKHHAAHHADENGLIEKEDTTGRYCPMTNWLNPILDRIRFFQFLEYFFKPRGG